MGIDEENLLVSMFASYVGVPKSITKISRNEYNPIFESMGIDSIVSPKLLTANEIVRYVRAMEDTTGGSVLTLYKIVDGKAEALEFSVKGEAKFLNLPLYRLKLKRNVLIAAIIRARKDDHPFRRGRYAEGRYSYSRNRGGPRDTRFEGHF